MRYKYLKQNLKSCYSDRNIFDTGDLVLVSEYVVAVTAVAISMAMTVTMSMSICVTMSMPICMTVAVAIVSVCDDFVDMGVPRASVMVAVAGSVTCSVP